MASAHYLQFNIYGKDQEDIFKKEQQQHRSDSLESNESNEGRKQNSNNKKQTVRWSCCKEMGLLKLVKQEQIQDFGLKFQFEKQFRT